MKRAILLILLLAGWVRAEDEPIDPNTIIDGWIASIGGEDARAAVNSIVIHDSMTTINGKKIDFASTFAGGGTYRVEVVGESDKRVFGCDGKTSWEKSETLGFGRSTFATILDIYKFHNPFYPLTLRGWFDSAEAVADETCDGKACHSYRMLPKGRGAEPQQWTVEIETGRVRTISVGEGNKRRLLEFDDYRSVPVNDTLSVTMPFRITLEDDKNKMWVQRDTVVPAGAQSRSLFTPNPTDLRDDDQITSILNRYALLGRTADEAAALHARKLLVTITTAATGITTHRTVSLKTSPLRILIDDVTIGMGESLEGYDGKAGWELSDILGYRPLKSQETSEMFAGLFPEADRSLVPAAQLRKLVGERIVDEKRTIAVGIANQFAALGVYYFDVTEGRLLRIALSKAPYARVPETTIDYSDFKAVDGFELAFTSVVTTAAAQSVISIDSIDNKANIEDTLFAPRKKFDREKPAIEAAKP